MSAHTTYKHQALPSHRSIRVISLKSTSPKFFNTAPPQDKSLEIELKEASLDTTPTYEALSYTWDAQTPDRTINCHGKLLKVTKNVEIALFRLRTSSKRRYLWIDSICIDQSSAEEKSAQIPLMGEIYGRAEKVLVWLGEGTVASERSFGYLKDVFAVIRPFCSQIVVDGGSRFAEFLAYPRLPPVFEQQVLALRASFQEENKQMFDREGSAESSMLNDIFQRKWFTRMWTVQELALGFNAWMVCGESELEWGDFMCAISFLAGIEHYRFRTISNESIFWSRLLVYQRLRAVIHPQLALVPGSQDKRMCKAVTSAHNLSSWDPRDKVYALYGYFAVLGIRNLPPVDYNLPVAQIYSEFTRAAILHDQSPDLLYSLGGKRAVTDLPSWTTDWSVPSELWAIPHDRFSASKTSPLRCSFGEHDTFQAWGIIIDTVKTRPNSHIPPGLEEDSEIACAIPNIIERVRAWQDWILLAGSHHNHPAGETWSQFLPKTILRNGLHGSTPHQTISGETMDEFVPWCKTLMSYHPRTNNREEAIKAVDAKVDAALQRPAVWATYFKNDLDPIPVINLPEWRILIALNDASTQAVHHWIYRMTSGAAFFITENGYTGVGSDLLELGDRVVLVSGMSLPMIVRPQEGGGSRLVGPAYVHGIMDGEKWPENEDELACFGFR